MLNFGYSLCYDPLFQDCHRDESESTTGENLIGAVALLLPNEVNATDALASSSSTVSSTSAAVLAGVNVVANPSEESQGQRTEAARRRRGRPQNHKA